MQKTFVLLILCALAACKKPVKAERAFVEEVADFYSKQSSISYDIKYKIKTFDEETDTVIYNASVDLIRKTDDTIFRGIVYYTVHDMYNNSEKDTLGNYSKYYNLKHIYTIDHKKQKTIRFDVSKGEIYSIKGNFDGELINTVYLSPEQLKNKLGDSEIRDTVFGGKDYVQVINNKNEDGDKRVIKYYINKDNRYIEKITFYAELDGQHQYNEWNLSNIKFNDVTPHGLVAKLEKTNYKIKDYIKPEPILPLSKGTEAPAFTALSYPDGKVVSLNNLKGKIVLLDFWYTSCHPCALAVPGLNAIQQKYKDKVIVLGVTASKEDKEPGRVKSFVKRYNVLYPLAHIDFETVKQYNITGFPQLYVIDKNGTIQAVVEGYSENSEKELEKIINRLL